MAFPSLHRGSTLTVAVVGLILGLVVAGCSSTESTRNDRSEIDRAPVVEPPPDRDRVKRLFIRGLTQHELENYDEAVLYFEQALDAGGENAAVLAALSQAYDRQGHPRDAIRVMERAVAADSGRPSYRADLADLYEDGGELERAADVYTSYLERFGFDEAVLFDLARVQTELGRTEEAIQSYRSILDQKGESLRARYRLLSLYRRTDQEEAMIETLEALARIDGDNEEIQRMLSEAYLHTNQLEKAAESLRRRMRRTQDRSDVVVQLADVYERMGQRDRADSLMQTVLESESRSVSELFGLARTIYADNPHGSSNRATAERLFEQVLEQDSEHGDALYFLGQIRFADQRFSEAARLLTRSVDQKPRRQRAWIQAGLSYLRAGRADSALTVIDEALILFPGNFHLLRLGGIAASQTNQQEKAIQYLTQATDPSRSAQADSLARSQALGTLGMVYARMNRTKEADSAYARAVALDSANATALNNLAYSLAEQGIQLEQAERMARRAVELAPDTASFLHTLG